MSNRDNNTTNGQKEAIMLQVAPAILSVHSVLGFEVTRFQTRFGPIEWHISDLGVGRGRKRRYSLIQGDRRQAMEFLRDVRDGNDDHNDFASDYGEMA